ncbi:MAG: hypothetical protein ACERKD_16075 [Prolixibacteraceae bacterium]
MIETAKTNLYQLKSLLEKLSFEEYTAQPKVLSGATIGDHFRHILEFYLLLVYGSSKGTICYDHRQRDQQVALDTSFAIKTIQHISTGLKTLDLNQTVSMEADYSGEGIQENKLITSLGRELAYCIEHSIHHQAIIKAGLIAIERNHLVDDQFGLAYSTIRYRNRSCAQ